TSRRIRTARAANSPARARPDAAPGLMCGRAMSGRPPPATSRAGSRGRCASPAASRAWSDSLPSAADGYAVQAQGRLPHADRHALPVLAAGAYAGIELEIITDHAHAMQVSGSIADQHGPFERPAELALLDLVGLRDI